MKILLLVVGKTTESYFSEAIKTIKRWKQHYTVTYETFKELLMEPVETFIKKLEMYDEKAMLQFRKMYPALTSGGEYNPVMYCKCIVL